MTTVNTQTPSDNEPVIRRWLELINTKSVNGREIDAADYVARELRAMGWNPISAGLRTTSSACGRLFGPHSTRATLVPRCF